MQLQSKKLKGASQLEEMPVRLSGTFEGVSAAIFMIVEYLSCCAREPWFPQWARNSRCAALVPGNLVQSAYTSDSLTVVNSHTDGNQLGRRDLLNVPRSPKIPSHPIKHHALVNANRRPVMKELSTDMRM